MILPKPKTARNPRYLKWIRSKPCLNGHLYNVAPHHEGNRGMGIKASDFDALPLCFECHRKRHDKGRSIWNEWGIDPVEKIKQFNDEWHSQQTGRQGVNLFSIPS